MRLKSIRIKNFRSIQDTSISLDRINVLVGGNDSGKSNILCGIKAFLSPQSEFANADYPRFASYSGSGRITDVKIEIIARGELDNSRSSRTISSILANMTSIDTISRVDNGYQVDYKQRHNNSQESRTSSRIDAKGNQVLPTVQYIDLSSAYYSLGENEWTELEDEIKEMLTRSVLVDDRMKMESTIDNALKDFWSSDRSSSLTISSNNDEFDISSIDQYRIRTSLGQRGTGFQAFIFLALQILQAIFRSNEDSSNLIILIEEPERMLHPQGQHDFVKLINQFVKDNDHVIFVMTTHSSVIVRSLPNANILLVRKDDAGHSYAQKKPYQKTGRPLETHWACVQVILCL